MKRRKFVKSSIVSVPVVASGLTLSGFGNKPVEKQVIEMREYELVSGDARKNLDNYLKEALIPALNKYGIKRIGVFSEYENSEPPKIYLLIPYASARDYFQIPGFINNDDNYRKNSSNYHKLPPDQKIYNRYHANLMVAFDGMPQLKAGQQLSGLYEMRTYEGYSENAVQRKIGMFNNAEIDIFKNIGLNTIFFGEVIAGKDLPCLTYMLAYSDMEERSAKWKAFGSDPEWNRIKGAPEYANTVSKAISKFLVPLPYSQI